MALNSTAACVLGLLDIGPPPPKRAQWEADGTMTAAEVWDSVERSVAGFWSLTRSQVYQELRRLANDGLVTVDGNRFAITPTGREAARQWFHEFAMAEPREESVRSPVTLSVFFGHYLSADLLERVVHEHELRYRRRLDTLEAIASTLRDDRSLPGSTLQRAIFTARGAIEWTHDVLDRIAASAPATKASSRRRTRPT